MTNKSLPDIIDHEEADLIFKSINRRYARGIRGYAIFKLMLNSGLRVSEICKLKEKDINLDKQHLIVKNGKGNKDRKIPFPADVIPFIKDWQEEKAKRSINSPYLFCSYKKNEEGKPLLTRYIQLLIKSYSRKAGLDNVHPHTLRHSYATALYQQTKDLQGIRQLLGHESIKTTQIYVNLSVADLKNTIQQFLAF